MKKVQNMTRIAIIALWPIVFLLIIGAMEMRFHIRDVLNFQIYYRLLLIPIYMFSACVFGLNIIYTREFIRKRAVVCAYVFSALTVISYGMFWALTLLRPVTAFAGHAIMVGVIRMPISVFSFVLGFTIFAAVRAIVLYKKDVKRLPMI